MTTDQELPSKEVAEQLLGEHFGLPIQDIAYLISRTGGQFGEKKWDIDDLLIAYFSEEEFHKAALDWMDESGDTAHFD